MRVSIEHKDELECLTLFLIFISISFHDIHALGNSYSKWSKGLLNWSSLLFLLPLKSVCQINLPKFQLWLHISVKPPIVHHYEPNEFNYLISSVCGGLQHGVTFSSLSSTFCSPLPWPSSIPLWKDLQFSLKMGQNLDHSLRPGINFTSLRSFSWFTKTGKGSPSPEALEHIVTLFPAF